MGRLTNWVRKKLGRDEPITLPNVSEPEEEKQQIPPSTGELPGYDSRHGTARAQRYWHRHLSARARSRKRTRRRITRETRRQNR